ncbi:MAG: OmpA family protein [Candidatus Omnitrophota bacterium]|nr:OmpA family protein [Candidatus Omnitrophota bacterium]
MQKNISKRAIICLIFLLSVSLLGCTVILQKGRRSDVEKISELTTKLNELDQTKRLLEDRLRQEIADKQVKVQMLEKGLTITFVSEVLFDSGKSKIKPEAYEALDKVATILKENVPDLDIGIEGHTDNVPIKYSSWKSNWELSSARAISVLHYIVDKKGVLPERVAAIGYGEYRPIASNDNKEGRQQNRRVEIVILPKTTKAKDLNKPVKAKTKPRLEETEENLK